MTANYIPFCEFDEPDYQIIAIHTVLQGYKLAYNLNESLNSKFKKVVPTLDYVIEGKKAFFSSLVFSANRSN